MALAAVVLLALGYSQPMWGFYLSSPQYPQGLMLSIRLSGVSGDVAEINTLNHYIGMAHLDQAAVFERAYAGYGVCGIGLTILLLGVLPWRRFTKWLAAPAVVFPLSFVGLTYYWMWTFGHHLYGTAPIKVAPFTPTLLGHGAIGNFRTLGLPGAGFFMSVASAVLVVGVVWLRAKTRAAEAGAPATR
jgi:hypothetical protein